MNSKLGLIIGGVVVLAAIVIIVIAQYGQRDIDPIVSEGNDNDGDNTEEVWTPSIVEAEYFYEDGEFVVAGEVGLPTPCHLLEWEVFVMESFPEQVMIDFTSLYEDEDELCAQVITYRPFRAEFSASEEASVSARFNGQDVNLNLFRVEDLSELDEFDPERKG